MTVGAQRPLADLTEKDWQRQVVDLSKLLGYAKAYHTFDSRRSASGFPDLVLVKDRVIFAELKRELTGKKSEDANRQPTAAQIDWLDKLAEAGGEVYLWRPSDLQEIADVLSRRWHFFAPAHYAHGGLGVDANPDWTPNSLWIPGLGRADTVQQPEQQSLLTKGAA